MSKNTIDQNTLLNEARKKKLAITIILVSGVRLAGIVQGFDNFCVVLNVKGKQQLIYKHAISTILL